MSEERQSVTVIGLGLMGSALARAFSTAGHDLTVWNRTREKTAPFERRARIAESVEAACTASDIVVVSVLDYAAVESLLHRDSVQRALSGKLLIQLTSRTPAEARREAEWAQRHGVPSLGGAIMAYPAAIGGDKTIILYSGSRAVFDANLAHLKVLGGKPTYCGDDPGAMAALDLALVAALDGAIAAVMHGAALCAAESTDLSDLSDLLNDFLGAAAYFGAKARTDAESGSYPSGNSTMITNTAFARLVLQASRDAGIDTSFPSWVVDRFTAVVDRGHGEDDIESLYEVFRPSAVAERA